jgi:hypothetical protein
MPPRPSDRALRRLVAELATVAPEDVQAILAGLEESQRETVEALLAGYQGEPEVVVPLPVWTPPATARIEGLSPWLEARLHGLPDTEFAMTAAATQALNACAAGLQPEAPVEAPPAPRARPWLDRLLGARAVL